MTTGIAPGRHSLEVVADELRLAADAKKCHACGCFQDTVRAVTDAAGAELGSIVDACRAAFAPKKYDCLGCEVCWPALAANALAEAFPDRAAHVAVCATEAPAERVGWPPLPGDFHVVRALAPVAVCTLNDGELAAALAARALSGLCIVGTMHTENLGIERLIRNVTSNPHIRVLVVCGADTRQSVGHLPGQSLAALVANGIDDDGRIVGARGKRPVLRNVSRALVDAFRRQVRLIDRIGVVDVDFVSEEIARAAEEAPGPFDGATEVVVEDAILADEPSRLVPDPAGYLAVYPVDARRALRVEHFSNAGAFTTAIEGRTPAAVYATVVERGLVTRLDHAAYLGRELARAERSLETGEPYVQDRAAGAIEPAQASPSACGCAGGCGEGGR